MGGIWSTTDGNTIETGKNLVQKAMRRLAEMKAWKIRGPPIARAINSRKRPSAKQAADGESVLAEARKKGFKISAAQTG